MRGRSVGRSVSFAYFAVPNSPRILAGKPLLAGCADGDLMWTSNYAPITDSIIGRAAGRDSRECYRTGKVLPRFGDFGVRFGVLHLLMQFYVELAEELN